MTSMIASCLGVVPGPQDRLLKVRCMGHGGVDNGSRWLTIAVVIRHVLPGVTFRLAFDHFDGAGYVIVATVDATLHLHGRLYTEETDPPSRTYPIRAVHPYHSLQSLQAVGGRQSPQSEDHRACNLSCSLSFSFSFSIVISLVLACIVFVSWCVA